MLPNGRVERWHCDNGGEFTATQIDDFCDEFAIRRSFSTPWAPPQNAQAERVWGILLRKMRIMMAHSMADVEDREKYWTFCMRQACRIHNLLPSSTLEGQVSPYEKLTGRLPDFSKLRVWGCKSFVLLPPRDRKSKLAPRAAEAIYLGRDPQRNGDIFYIPSLDRFTTSCHARFHETEFVDLPASSSTGGESKPTERRKCPTVGCDLDEGHDGPHSFELVGQDIEGSPSRNLRQGAVRNF